MMDKIFGSEELEEKIEELKVKIEEKEERIRDLKEEIEDREKEMERKEGKVEKERDRAKEAVTEKQRTDKELKDAKQKITSLEDKVKRLEESREEEQEYKEVRVLPRGEAISFLSDLESYRAGDNSLSTHYFTDPGEVGKSVFEEAANRIDSQTGYVAFWDEYGLINFILVPPLPLENDFYREDRFTVDKLLDLYGSDVRIGFASVHAGKSGVGVLVGDELEEFKVVSRFVKGKHSKGGFSQGRFERRRDEQEQKLVDKIIDKFNELVQDVDFVILSGNESIVSTLDDELSTDAPVIKRSLNVQKIDGEDTEELIEQLGSCRLYVL